MVQYLAHLVHIADHRQGVGNQLLQRFACGNLLNDFGPVTQHDRVAGEKAFQLQIRDAAVAFAADADHLVDLQGTDEFMVREGVAPGRLDPVRVQKAKMIAGHGMLLCRKYGIQFYRQYSSV